MLNTFLLFFKIHSLPFESPLCSRILSYINCISGLLCALLNGFSQWLSLVGKRLRSECFSLVYFLAKMPQLVASLDLPGDSFWSSPSIAYDLCLQATSKIGKRATRVVQSGKLLPLAQFIILGSQDRAPCWALCSMGSLLLPLPLLCPSSFC